MKLEQYRLDLDEYPGAHSDGDRDDQLLSSSSMAIILSLITFGHRGFFGALTLNPDVFAQQFTFRRSQRRYRFEQSDSFEIYALSRWRPVTLRPNAMLILFSLGVSAQTLYQMVVDRMKLLHYARSDDVAAKRLHRWSECGIPLLCDCLTSSS